MMAWRTGSRATEQRALGFGAEILFRAASRADAILRMSNRKHPRTGDTLTQQRRGSHITPHTTTTQAPATRRGRRQWAAPVPDQRVEAGPANTVSQTGPPSSQSAHLITAAITFFNRVPRSPLWTSRSTAAHCESVESAQFSHHWSRQ